MLCYIVINVDQPFNNDNVINTIQMFTLFYNNSIFVRTIVLTTIYLKRISRSLDLTKSLSIYQLLVYDNKLCSSEKKENNLLFL